MNKSFRKALFIFFAVFVSQNIFSQSKPRSIYIEKNIVRADSFYNCFFSYRLPFENLVFVKKGDSYSGGMNLTLELVAGDSLIKRVSSDEDIMSENYNESESSDKYLQGLLSTKLPPDKYTATPIINLHNTKRVIKLPPFSFSIDDSNTIFSQPIPVLSGMKNCSNDSVFHLVNFQNSIPFSNKQYNLLIPVSNVESDEINVEILQNEKSIETRLIKTSGNFSIKINKCGKIITVSAIPDAKQALFILNNFSSKLNEGPFKLKVTAGEKEHEFNMEVAWVDKPHSLLKPEFAVELIKDIAGRDEVAKILDADKKDYYKKLVEFWKPEDPVPGTYFNEIMNEFYKRADYALKNYSTVDRRNGAKTARGKIYMRFGKPDDVVRSYSDNNAVIEVWKYTKMNKEFTFFDQSGLGNFTLL